MDNATPAATRAPYTRRTIARRRLLRGGALGGIGAAAFAIVGCGDDDDSPKAASSAPSTPSTAGTAAPSPAKAVRKRGGTVTIGDTADIIAKFGIDPHLSVAQSGIWRMVYDPLVATSSNGSIDQTASLMESYETPEPTRVVFHLRKNVKFHDGTAFDAEAVRFNLVRAQDKSIKGGGVYAATFGVIDTIESPDAATVVFTLKRPDATLLTNLSERGGFMLSPTYAKASSLDVIRTKPTGTGPYRLMSWQADQRTVFQPNEDHWRKREDGGRFALLDEVRLNIIPDPVVLVASLQSGDVEVIISPASQRSVLDADSNLTSISFKGNNHVSWWVNHGRAPSNNLEFRRALMAAWDKMSFNKVFYQNFASEADSLLTTACWAHKAASGYPKFDMAAARQHMANSGIPEAERQLEMFGTTPEAVTMLQALAKAWEPLGVRVKMTTNADGMTRLWANRGMAADVSMVTEGGTRADPGTTMQLALTKTGGWNVGGAAVPEIEPLVAKGAQTYDVKERQQIYAQIQDLHAQNLYSILPALYTSVGGYLRKGVTGLAFDANGKEVWMDLGRA